MDRCFRLVVLSVCLSVCVFHSRINSQTISLNKSDQSSAKVEKITSNFNLQSITDLRGDGWGYNYDSLYIDLDKWRVSPYVKIDSIGASVQNRALWMVSIYDVSSFETRRRITIHTRTHPNEVQSFYATRGIINMLLSDSSFAKEFRKKAIFNIVPMYNPDGVELGFPRQNANGVDLERNWDTENPEPEVAALKALYLSYMNSDLPINVALNMHGDGGAQKNYFVYHHESGTSLAYTEIEKQFIGGVHGYWTEGISDWDAFVSWTGETPTYYPESWFWLNYHEAVLALTYEEITPGPPENYVKTANAMLRGIADFLGIGYTTDVKPVTQPPDDFAIVNVYPNPVSAGSPLNVKITLPQETRVNMILYDVLGRQIKKLAVSDFKPGEHYLKFFTSGLASGVYYLNAITASGQKTIPVMIFK